MKRYFLITVGIGGREVEAPYSVKNGKFINRKELIEHIMNNITFKGSTPVIKMIYEFKSEQDYLDFVE